MRGVPTKVVCAECMKMCCLGGKNLRVNVNYGLHVRLCHTCDGLVHKSSCDACKCLIQLRIHPSTGLGVPSGLGRMVVGVILLLLVLSGDVETPVGEFLVYCSVVYTKALSKEVICNRGQTCLSNVSFPSE